MMTAGVLLFDELGRIRTTTLAIGDFNGGTPTNEGGKLSVAILGVPTSFIAGIGYLGDGRVCDSGSPLNPQGPITNDQGQIRASNGPAVYWYAGLPFAADGTLSIDSGAPPPVDTFAYSNAFSSGFDGPFAP